MAFLRSVLFDIFFTLISATTFIVFFIPMKLLPRVFTVKLFQGWTKVILGGLHYIVGIRYTIQNIDTLKAVLAQGPCIIALKHQSAFETILLSLLAPHMVIVLKQELMKIPVYGHYLKKLNSIAIDRLDNASGLAFLRQAQDCAKQGYSIAIFPEGKRYLPSILSGEESPDYKGGVGLLYRTLNIPVVPIALNSGVFWNRASYTKRPGHIILKILDVIQPGLDRPVFLNLLKSHLDTESEVLCREALGSSHLKAPRRKKIAIKLWLGMGIISILIYGGSLLWAHSCVTCLQKQFHMTCATDPKVVLWTAFPHIVVSDVSFPVTDQVMVKSTQMKIYPLNLAKKRLIMENASLWAKDQPVLTCDIDIVGETHGDIKTPLFSLNFMTIHPLESADKVIQDMQFYFSKNTIVIESHDFFKGDYDRKTHILRLQSTDVDMCLDFLEKITLISPLMRQRCKKIQIYNDLTHTEINMTPVEDRAVDSRG